MLAILTTSKKANFNSRPCVRGDEFLGSDRITINIFQFAPLREGRPP